MTWDLGQLKSYLLAVFFWHLLHWYGLELLLMFVPDLDTYALPLTNWKRKWGVSMWVWNRTPQNPTIDHPYFPIKIVLLGYRFWTIPWRLQLSRRQCLEILAAGFFGVLHRRSEWNWTVKGLVTGMEPWMYTYSYRWMNGWMHGWMSR